MGVDSFCKRPDWGRFHNSASLESIDFSFKRINHAEQHCHLFILLSPKAVETKERLRTFRRERFVGTLAYTCAIAVVILLACTGAEQHLVLRAYLLSADAAKVLFVSCRSHSLALTLARLGRHALHFRQLPPACESTRCNSMKV